MTIIKLGQPWWPVESLFLVIHIFFFLYDQLNPLYTFLEHTILSVKAIIRVFETHCSFAYQFHALSVSLDRRFFLTFDIQWFCWKKKNLKSWILKTAEKNCWICCSSHQNKVWYIFPLLHRLSFVVNFMSLSTDINRFCFNQTCFRFFWFLLPWCNYTKRLQNT